MKRKNSKIELLVPAGGPEQLIAAVENGADAVYLGGRLFNARMNAGNFDDETMQKAVDFAHKRGVQVHVTMNILLGDEEIPEALKYAAFLYEAGVDALIVADLGLGKRIRETMLDFPLHLSTQATVYNLAGVEAAGRLGYQRVVLSRELSLPEIREICGNTDVEIEVFAHGALCVCYSGQCQLSRFFGNRSGNRGKCAQPCRLPYQSLLEKTLPVDAGESWASTSNRAFQDSEEFLQYPLSPKDQCLIDHLGELEAAGVTSLKIEGRMKSADYVGVVTSIYRKYLDLYEKNGTYTVDPKDREALAQIFNRGSFTDAYLRGESGAELMSGELPKHGGIYIGKVVRRVPRTDLLEVDLEGPLEQGDGIEIRGKKERCGNKVTYFRKEKGILRIGDIRGNVQKGDPIYRISARQQLTEVRKTYEEMTLDGGKERKRTNVDFRVIGRGNSLTVIGTHESGKQVQITATAVESGTLNLERLEQSLRKSGNTPFAVGTVRVEGDFSMSMKTSEMNGLRRQTLEKLEEALEIRREKPEILDFTFVQEVPPKGIEYYFYSWDPFVGHVENEGNLDGESPGHYEELPAVYVIPLWEYMHHYEDLPADLNILPYVSNVTRGAEEQWIEAHFKEICEKCRERGIYVGNLGWIQPFREQGIPVYGDYGLNVYNSQASAALDTLGVRFSVQSLESNDDSNGAYPLMVLEHEVPGEMLVSEKYGMLQIVKRPWSSQTLLLPGANTKPGKDHQTPNRNPGCQVYRYYCR